MATKKKKKVVKKVVAKKATAKKAAPKKTVKVARTKKSTVYGMDRDFLIISGGGLLVIILTLALLIKH